MEIKSWEDYFLDLAKTCASRSNCLRAQVGAVIVGEDKKIKATGYNGTPSKVESCYERGECYRIKNVVLRKDANSPIVHVTVDDIRRELEEA